MQRSNWQRKVVFAYLQEPPFCFREHDGSVAGCDVDLARMVLEQIGVAQFEPVLTDFADMLPGLADGRWTMTTGLFITDERRELAHFTRPIWALGDGLLIRRGDAGRLTSYRSVVEHGATLAVVKEQVQHSAALRAGIPAHHILVFDSQEEAAHAVRSGAADAYASVAMAHRGYLQNHPGSDLLVVDIANKPEGLERPFGAFAIARSASGLHRAVDESLSRFLGSATHRRLMRGYGFAEQDIDAAL